MRRARVSELRPLPTAPLQPERQRRPFLVDRPRAWRPAILRARRSRVGLDLVGAGRRG